jgi:hypothetical protein
MSNRIRCACPRCTIRGFMVPAFIITLGVLFLLHEMRGGFFDITNTLPVILIVLGMISLASSMAPMTGHVSADVPPVPPPGTPGSAPTVAQPSLPGQGQ